MNVPVLAEWLRWLREMPASFRAEPAGFGRAENTVPVQAIVNDLWETLFAAPPEPGLRQMWVAQSQDAQERNRLRYVLAACHLLWHPFFRTGWLANAALRTPQLQRFLVQEVATVASVAAADSLATDVERGEELVRRALRCFELRLPGESATESSDRLTQVDSVERRRLLNEVAKRQEKLRREAEIRRKAAEAEAASKMPRE